MPSPELAVSPGALTWSVQEGWVALSSASVGGGLVRPRWVANLTVEDGFARTDLDAYVAERLASTPVDAALAGTALLTAADVTRVERAGEPGPTGDVTAWATVGVTKPTWAAREQAEVRDGIPAPGTVNIVVALPAALTGSALVQAVGTVTEAKAQALVAAGVPGTGTASDAVVVLCPEGEEVPFAGVRSPWGQAVARAVHRAVAAGLEAHPWVDDGRVW
ncbi:adenosylcobinamide amidohydrolase [Ornithinimicrobium tianjinense]|uniref:Adenosylcobinamide amidohydrolase n=1 Tax=Ornithinimicrobium tianjinense TaxID=1195761 RepID=A0A917BPV8_9MICO|nr:adenosylcobinamide amidohydrolase [Ornithinimicrobium tianjinense]GGF52082.1 adenosylcobinamide amidohydrolase [Ornithinimicrobium tianjinense]